MNVQYRIVGVDPQTNEWDIGSAPGFEGIVYKAVALPRKGEELELHDGKRAKVVRVEHRLYGIPDETVAKGLAEKVGDDEPPTDWKDLKHADVVVGVVPLP